MSEPLMVEERCYPWQYSQWTRLQQQVNHGRLPHALLLAGPEGIGKNRFATAFAAGWLCRSPEQGQACGRCQSCRLLRAGSHPDLNFPQPSGKSQQLKVDDIRQLVGFCSKTAQLGERRLVLITPASSMNSSAQNALLKTLEEPGNNTLLLLVADQPQLLLPTIRSRCQQLWFPEVPTTEALSWLLSQQLEQTLAEAALAAMQTPLKALELASASWFAQRQQLVTSLLALARGQAAVAVVEKQLASIPQAELLQVLAHWCHQTLRNGFLHQQPVDPALSTMLELAHCISSRSMLCWYESLRLALMRLRQSANLNKELQLDVLLWELTPDGRASRLQSVAY